MNRTQLQREIESLDPELYFEETEDGTSFLCKQGMDLGIDLKDDGILIYDEPEGNILYAYDTPNLIDKVNSRL